MNLRELENNTTAHDQIIGKLTDTFHGKVICISGKFNTTHIELKNIIENKLCGWVTSRLSKHSDYILVGRNASPTIINKAIQLNITILKGEDFNGYFGCI